MKKNKQKISVFNYLVFLIATSLIVIIYINNIVYVNQLAASNINIREDIEKASQKNELLRTEIEKLSSFERVKSLAKEKLNLYVKENSGEEKNNIVVKKSELR